MSLRKYANQPSPRTSRVIYFDDSFFVLHAKPDANILGRTLMQNPVIINSKVKHWKAAYDGDWNPLMVGQTLLLGEILVCVEDVESEWLPIEAKLKALFDSELALGASAKTANDKDEARVKAEADRAAKADAIVNEWLLPKEIVDIPRYDESEIAKSIGPNPTLYALLIPTAFEMAGLTPPEKFSSKDLASDTVLRTAAGNLESEAHSEPALSSGVSSQPADIHTS